jgi:hypothetical protein
VELTKYRPTTGVVYGVPLIQNAEERQRLYTKVDQFYTGDPYDDVIYKEAKKLFLQATNLAGIIEKKFATADKTF